ncbi:hypothetical protein Cantr_01892 [Candida viswanathii]|uniref:Uncharacterized protein n=1 Tax=Candida viswanathii TaxID=5486 RepID=A0A367YK32_9ASCO|nr:hypothetical protein Cantr_01892 [Candida viswanathii]
MNPKSPSSKKTERKLRFPDNLTELEITVGDAGESIKTLGLSYLACLEKLKVNSLGEEEEEYLHCYLMLPSSLKELRCESGHFMAGALDKMSPPLTKLKVKEVPLEHNQLVSMMKSLPPALEHFEVPQRAFPNALSTATVRKVKRKPQKVPAKIALPPQQKAALPSTSKEFKLGRLDLDKSDPVKFDFDASDLPNLDTLQVSGNKSLRLAGKFPSNITTMRLSYISKLDLTHLDSLQSLTKLEITGGIGTHEFTFKLPESLKFLEVSTAELRKIHVNAPNLQELTLYGNEYGVLNENNFVIPMNLKKLSLGMCDIEQINVSLPGTLTELRLESMFFSWSVIFQCG